MTEYRDNEQMDSGKNKETTILYQNDGAKDDELREALPKPLMPQSDKPYTYADYCNWEDGGRWEMIDGVAYAMAAPTFAHQMILTGLHLRFGNFLKGHSCIVLLSPFDVRLNADEADDTVVQPDLLVVCDRAKLSDVMSCRGAPDLIIEILSPSNPGYDRLTKFNRYLRAGVKEYWMVDPETKSVQICSLRDGSYDTIIYTERATVPVGVLPGLEISLPEVFAELDL